MKSLEQDHIQSLTRSASPDVLHAMNGFVHRLLGMPRAQRMVRSWCSCTVSKQRQARSNVAGVSDTDDLRAEHSESDAVELGRLLFWLMVVGYRFALTPQSWPC